MKNNILIKISFTKLCNKIIKNHQNKQHFGYTNMQKKSSKQTTFWAHKYAKKSSKQTTFWAHKYAKEIIKIKKILCTKNCSKTMKIININKF